MSGFKMDVSSSVGGWKKLWLPVSVSKHFLPVKLSKPGNDKTHNLW